MSQSYFLFTIYDNIYTTQNGNTNKLIPIMSVFGQTLLPPQNHSMPVTQKELNMHEAAQLDDLGQLGQSSSPPHNTSRSMYASE